MESLGGKYAGIYTKKLKNEVVTYFISYRNFEQKVVREKIGQSPDMNKTKALKILSDKKEEISLLKKGIKEGVTDSISIKSRKKINVGIVTLNDCFDFFLEDNKDTFKNIYDLRIRHDYHMRHEMIANKALQLITREDLIEYIGRKKLQKADKRRYKQEDKSVDEKEYIELLKNQETIFDYKTLILKLKNEGENTWIYENKIKYLERKNTVIETRLDKVKAEKLWNDKSIGEDDKRQLLGLLSNKTIKDIFNSSSSAINYMKGEKGLNLPNPFIISKRDQKLFIKVDNIRDRFLTMEEVNLFLKEIKRISYAFDKHKNIYLMCLFGLSIAARQSTIMSIKISDIDLVTGNINLRNHKTERYYNSYVANKEVENEILRLSEGRDKDEYIFLTYLNEKPYRYPRKVQEVLNYTVNFDRPFLKWLSVKDFRNTAASHLAINGVPLQHISKVLDHASIKTTERYAHLFKDTGSNKVTEMLDSFIKE